MSSLRVLIADGSPSVRAVLRRIVEGAGGLEVAGEARDGDEAVSRAVQLCPDAVVMDADLVLHDGRLASEEMVSRCEAPVVVIASGLDRERMVATFRTLRKGVVAVLAKPTVPQQWHAMTDTLGQTLKHIVRARGLDVDQVQITAREKPEQLIRNVVVGASTGGPKALAEMLSQLGRGFAAGVAVVQHIAPGFEGALVQWLAAESGLDVALASDGESLRAGCVRLALADRHLMIDHCGRLRLDSGTPPYKGHRPSIDVLFRSMVNRDAQTTAAVLLSGMGADGSLGMNELKAAGAMTIAQDEPSSAVWGMPRVAAEIGAADFVLPPVAIGRLLREAAGGDG